jgi:uncharacterized protein
MGKVVFWIVIVFAVLLALRLLNSAAGRRRADDARRAAAAPDRVADTMVRCIHCGIFLPRADARSSAAGPTCADPACESRR